MSTNGKDKEPFIPFALPLIGEEEVEAVSETLRSGWITTGPKVKEFEKAFASYVGARYAVAVNSCTAALHLALEAVGVEEGDEVLTTPFTFAATAEVIRYFKAKPVFIDIDRDTMNMDPEALASGRGSAWSPEKASAIIPVHFAGLPCEMDAIKEVAAAGGMRVVEDAAHALPSEYKGRRVGSIGDVTCFSFYATKTITTAEGGMLTTDDESLAERVRVMSLHGISRDAWLRYTEQGNWRYDIIAPGYKYNMSDVAAAMGIVQLGRCDAMRERRAEIAAAYDAAFASLDSVELPPRPSGSSVGGGEGGSGAVHSWHLYVIRLKLGALTIDRDRFIEEMKGRRIGVSVHFIPLHLHPYYRDTYGLKAEDFPVATATFERVVSLPIYPRMTGAEVERVACAVLDIAEKFGK